MRKEPDGWAKEWLDKMRENGSKGLTLEKVGNTNYVYWASTKWDKDTKKRKKLTEYIGILEPPANLVISSDIDIERMEPREIAAAGIDKERNRKREPEIQDYRIRGTMMVLKKACDGFYLSLKDCFPTICDDLLMLAMARLAGHGRLEQAGGWFNRQDNLMALNAHRDPEMLSAALKAAGASVEAQNRFYESLKTPGKKLAVDMTVCFSKGKAFIVKRGTIASV